MARGKRREVDPTTPAGRLRALRSAAGLTQKQAGEIAVRRRGGATLNQSRISRIEAGAPPTLTETRVLIGVYDVPADVAADLTEGVKGMSETYVDARVILQSGEVFNFQRRMTDAQHAATRVRSYQPATIIGVLQTRAYADVVFEPDADLQPADAGAALEERMAQGRLLLEPGRTWHLIQTEAALRYPVRSYDLQVEQLEHIITLSRLPHVHFGVVELDTIIRETGPLSGFHLYDDNGLVLGTDLGTALTGDPKRVATFADLFTKVDRRAVYGDDARAVVARIADEYRRRGNLPVT